MNEKQVNLMNNPNIIRVGSRKSELALIQTRYVISLLEQHYPEKQFEIITMSTLGDKILDIPLPKIGEKSLFTKELETALTTGCVDFVVHSLKDLPTILPYGMCIGAVLTREDPRDALVLEKTLKQSTLEELPDGSVIGTSSLRRTAQLAKKYPNLKVENIRGNLNTRLKKLDDLGQYQGIILAAAGLKRMGWEERITKILECDELLYAVGQGALAIECKESNEKIIELLKPLYDVETAIRVIAERSFLKTLGGGCSAPVAVSSDMNNVKDKNYRIVLKGAVWSLDGQQEITADDECDVELKERQRCAICPYAMKNQKSCIGDIECLASSSPKKIVKKPKLDIPTELLKNDPHEQCPVKLPIGIDFMGQCPYLENELVTIHGKTMSASQLDYKECPFLSGNLPFLLEPKSTQDPSCSNDNINLCPYRDNKTYCGLVAHDKAPIASFEESLNLGMRLAENLMKNGAKEVMAKAQATIHAAC